MRTDTSAGAGCPSVVALTSKSAQSSSTIGPADQQGIAIAGVGPPGLSDRSGGRVVVEHGAVAAIEPAFDRQTLGQNDLVVVQLDMEIPHGLNRTIGPHCAAVDQRADRDKHSAGENRVVAGQADLAPRKAVAEGAGRDSNWPCRAVIQQRFKIDLAATDPNDSREQAAHRFHRVALAQILDGGGPVPRGEARAGDEAGGHRGTAGHMGQLGHAIGLGGLARAAVRRTGRGQTGRIEIRDLDRRLCRAAVLMALRDVRDGVRCSVRGRAGPAQEDGAGATHLTCNPFCGGFIGA
jgi:hypothetical protein